MPATAKATISLPNGWATRPYQKDLWEYKASGGKRTFRGIMSALPLKADISQGHHLCPLMTLNGHKVDCVFQQEKAENQERKLATIFDSDQGAPPIIHSI